MTNSANETIDPKVIDRITKLLAMANDQTTTEEEAAAFAAKAHEMLVKHNLDPAALKAAGESEEKIEYVASTFKYASPAWRKVADSVAYLYFCKRILMTEWDPTMGRKGGLRPQFRFYGKHHNAVVAQYMFDYLTRTIIRLSQKHSKDRGEQLQFERGCCIGIQNRLIKMRHDSMNQSVGSGGGLPALYDNEFALIEDFFKIEFPDIKKKGNSMRIYNSDSLQAGRKAANEIPLNTPLAAPKGAKMLT